MFVQVFLLFIFFNPFECQWSTTKPQWFDRIFVIQFENTGFQRTMRSVDFSNLATKGKLFTNFYAAFHPSQPNYWAHGAATNFGVYNNDFHERDDICLADLFERNHVSWKAYQEDYPGNCRKDEVIGYYARRHNPFISFKSVYGNVSVCAKIVNATELDTDLNAGTLPQYSFYTPNVRNDGHDTGIFFGGEYLTRFLAPRLNKFPQKTLVVVTFDEDGGEENNRIYTLLVGDMVQSNTTDNSSHTVYSLVRTIEDNWGMGNMGRNDVNATPLFKPLPPPTQPIKPGKWFDRIFILQFENTGFRTTMANAKFANLTTKGKLFTHYYAVYHPSQPNYFAAAAATHYGNATNLMVNLTGRSIADLMDENGVSWKTYQEDYPGNCFTGEVHRKYVRKHNPFISFVSIHSNATRCARIVNSDELDIDLERGTLPQYSFYTPNMDNDGHDTNIDFGGEYLARFITPRLSKFPPKTLIVVTFDEDWYDENNHIYTLFIGDMIAPGTRDNMQANTFSLVRTVEDNWDMGNLGNNDVNATVLFANVSAAPTRVPTRVTTTATSAPTTAPTSTPTTAAPTPAPTTASPTIAPINAITNAPTKATQVPTEATQAPTLAPTPAPTEASVNSPTEEQTNPPTESSRFPTPNEEVGEPSSNRVIIIASIISGAIVVFVAAVIVVLKMMGVEVTKLFSTGRQYDQGIQLNETWDSDNNIDLDNDSSENEIEATSSDSGFGDD